MSEDSISKDLNVKTKKDITVVPWYNPNQFKKVHEFLYSSDITKKRWAVDQISVWETRCYPCLPTAIEASLILTRAIIQDILFSNGNSFCQEKDIQMMYSMALVRFVNLTIEVHKMYPSTSMSQIAKGIGIPSWIVDLRNEATHAFGPSLPTLRMAAEASMKFLNVSFWEKEFSNLKNLEREHFDDNEIKDLIRRYILSQFRIMKSKHMKDELRDYRLEDAEECKVVLMELASYVHNYKREFIDILVSNGFFIPYDDELKCLITPSDFVQYDVDDETEDITQHSIPPVPTELEYLWRRFLNMLNMMQGIPLFLETLLKSQANRSRIGKKLVISWAMKFLRIQSYYDTLEQNSVKKIFRSQGMTMNWHSMFYAAVSKPCLYTPFLFSMIYAHLDFDEEVTREILTLMAIYLGQADWSSVDLKPDHTIYTVEDLKKVLKLQNSEKENTAEEGVWSVMQDPCFKSWPIGLIVNPVHDLDKTEDHVEDVMAIEYLDEKMDVPEEGFFNNKNDIEECFLENQPNISEDTNDYLDLNDLDLRDKGTFLYRIK